MIARLYQPCTTCRRTLASEPRQCGPAAEREARPAPAELAGGTVDSKGPDRPAEHRRGELPRWYERSTAPARVAILKSGRNRWEVDDSSSAAVAREFVEWPGGANFPAREVCLTVVFGQIRQLRA